MNVVNVYTHLFGPDWSAGSVTAAKAYEEGNKARTIGIAPLVVF
jgi:hypothetical protein